MILRRNAGQTLTPIELFHGDIFEFSRTDGDCWMLELLDTGAAIMHTTLETPGVEVPDSGDTTTYRFWAEVRVNGRVYTLERQVGTQRSFYEPWCIDGVNIWLDAVDAIFQFMHETHGPCRLMRNCSHQYPEYKHARLVFHEANRRICPDTLHPWCPLPEGCLRIEDCYRGEDCWLGAYDGASAHGGLDINHPTGTPLYVPLDLDNQCLIRSTADGYNNNSWRGFRRWPDGSEWVLGTAHMTKILVRDYQPLAGGTHYAEGAGVWIGAAAHTHFTFMVSELGERYLLDPWILFRQMYQDQAANITAGCDV